LKDPDGVTGVEAFVEESDLQRVVAVELAGHVLKWPMGVRVKAQGAVKNL
jgi:hypothetical protein